jgi:hypothetical protein
LGRGRAIDALRSTLRWTLIAGFALIAIFFALAVVWLVAVQLDIIPHGQ